MRAFELVTARDSRHAVALLAEHGPSVKILATKAKRAQQPKRIAAG